MLLILNYKTYKHAKIQLLTTTVKKKSGCMCIFAANSSNTTSHKALLLH